MKRCKTKREKVILRPILLRVCVHFSQLCVFTSHSCVCVHLDGLNAEQKFWVWVTSIIIIILYITIILILHIQL